MKTFEVVVQVRYEVQATNANEAYEQARMKVSCIIEAKEVSR